MTKNHTDYIKNTIKHANKPRNEIRKAKYAVTDEAWIKALLTRGALGTLGTVHEAQPFVTPINYIYIEEDHAIYFHGAYVGRLRANMDINPNVCFNVSEMGRILPYEKAAEFGIEYNSVVVFGQAELVESDEKTGEILQLILDKYAPHLKPNVDYKPIPLEEIKRTAVYKIKIEDWTGKQLVDDGESINPFYYEHMPVIRHE